MKVFIDSNIPMYVAGSSHPNREPARRFLRRVSLGEIEGVSSTEVLQEILYRYGAIGRRDLADQVYESFVPICLEIYPVELDDMDLARALLDVIGKGRSSCRSDVKPGHSGNRDLRPRL